MLVLPSTTRWPERHSKTLEFDPIYGRNSREEFFWGVIYDLVGRIPEEVV